MFLSSWKDAENNKSVAPAEKLNPARNPTNVVIVTKIPYSKA